ncbi:hypothetical protein SUDANB96_06212 [Streptomyces sp. enrichment culture]
MTEPSYLAAVRASYDTVAADYAAEVKFPSELDPLSRGMLAAFAELVRDDSLGPVADVGCGPGKVTAHLVGLGVRVFGVDISPRMVEPARAAHPGLRWSRPDRRAAARGRVRDHRPAVTGVGPG